MGKPNSPKVQFWEGVVAVRRASSSHLGSFIRDAVKQFNDIATLRRIDALNEMTALYKKYQQELSSIGGNLNQIVKRANELAITGKLDQYYYSNLLYPRIKEIQELICEIKDEQQQIVTRLIHRKKIGMLNVEHPQIF